MWKKLLTEYNETLLKWKDLHLWCENHEKFKKEKWFGFTGVSDKEILEAEKKLNVKLPEEIRSFYKFSNGWGMISPSVYKILPIQELGYLKEKSIELYEPLMEDIDLFEEDEQYVYDQITTVCRSIVLSVDGDATTLVCDPKENFRVSQWSSWIPGIEWENLIFYQWMEQELEQLKEIIGEG